MAILLVGCGMGCLSGCLGPPPPPAPAGTGGLEAENFEKISLNGFDPQDNQADHNDYAWSMEYFDPDGDAPSYVYVGTGNDIFGIVDQSVRAYVGVENQRPYETRPPEIRRWRTDVQPPRWETVLDYRDVETGPGYSTFGFRAMRQYRAPSDGVNRLYAGTFGNSATLWRSATGDPGSWQIAWELGEVGSIRALEEHNELLYIAIANDAPGGQHIGRIFVFDGAQVTPVVSDGFGNPENDEIYSLASFNGWLYAGTHNHATGYEVWKLAGPGGRSDPVLVVDRGGPSTVNLAVFTMCVFHGRLYVGNNVNTRGDAVSKGADIIRINPDDTWETVVGRDSISGYSSGFDAWPNAYIWAMAVHDGWLYTGTYDRTSYYFADLLNIPRLIKSALRLRPANPFELIWRGGADLYKTRDGTTWYPITLDGFGDVGNYGFRTMESVGDFLYIGTANPFDGLEIWRGRSSE